jgi:hypothetical protein
VIVSALAGELALDGGPTPGHSLFTGCLLEALRHGLRQGGDATASSSEIGLYLQKRLAQYPDARQTPSIRRFDFDDGGELTVRLARVASGTAPILQLDANAALRDRLVTELAEQFSDRSAIARVVQAATPRIDAVDLPVGGAAMIWGYVLAELTHAGAFSEIEALIAAAREHPAALNDPEPAAFLEKFGDSTIDFELVAWSREMSHSPRRFRSDLNYLICKHLSAAGIEIPNPQRDLHIRSGTLKVENVTTKESGD